MSRVIVLCSGRLRGFDGVADYSYELTEHLRRHLPAALVLRSTDDTRAQAPAAARAEPPVFVLASWRDLWRTRRRPPWGEASAWLVQYVPQQLVGRGDLLALLAWLARIRLTGLGRVVLTVHEYNVPLTPSLRRIAARVALDALFLAIGAIAERIVVTHELNRRKVSRVLFWKPRDRVTLIPVSSTVPVANGESPRSGRDPRGALVSCVIFGQPEAMSSTLVSAFGSWLSTQPAPVRTRWIGRSRQAILDFWTGRCGLSPDRVEVHAALPDVEVSRLLRESDVLLAPIVDGVSTRRTTIMAALYHGLPVVGTDGACTDEVLRQSAACLLTPCADAEAFVRSVACLAGDAVRRETMGRAARALFDERFSWDHVTRAYLAQITPDVRPT